MASRWLYIAVATLLLTVDVDAQERKRPSRAELDLLVNPSLSATAFGTITAEPTTVNLGKVADSKPRDALFTLRNTTTEAIEIATIRSSCSCLKVVTPITHIEVGESVTLRAKFNPSGRNGAFAIPLHIYTSLDTLRPTLRLVVEGSVVATDGWSHLPQRMGVLRLSRKSVTLDRESHTERIAIANTGDRELRVTAQPTLEGITLHTEPTVLKAGEEGDMVITYKPTTMPKHDMETAIIVEGCGEARPSERMIKITIKH